ncbi:MFS transporter [Arthrobacter sp. StoSoilB3]|uniref:MFS transporter n=1 Tax=Paenarthrobacter TaxID=1742992 RepID=UPI00057C3BC4|nr:MULTISPECIES: MFS transporter [Paenarthrobacter]KIA73759.1 major facilitator superfamily transporter [Arthrobacter sp. MWB30]SKB88618.1 MFS-type transporter involved in bile tolerance, Atg22 family [Arthrobacter sp. 31Cvi3.1E]BCW10260.1 MFS transporter [Arthrobacter sp. NtRootA2]BCW14340.1 MFS transporter [Arthrobacter sp. NtRootA4]BCW22676.1 MFS transporter [Arthrobacter sp. NtRootC7]BCW26945.1 MFS transporter [Arthrobacter sp. NtRootC45]BCW31215.1 MFS transporter [Arthrobacter sp. NtRoo
MNFALYKEMLSIRPVRRLLVVGMVARIPHSAAGVLLTLHIVLTLGQGYAAAGAAAAVMTIGIALGAPWRGRRVDMVGLRKALIPSVVSETVIWSIVPHVSYQWLLPLVFIGGLFTLPIFSVVRQSLGVMVDGEQRRSAFALDSIATELVFMIGPAVGAVVATSGYSALGLTAVGISVSVAGLFLMWFNPPTRSEAACTPEESADRESADLAAAEAAMVASAPAHVQEAASEMASATSRTAGLRSRVARNFTWFTVSVAALFAVAAGSGMVLSGSDVSIVGLLERGGHQNEIGIVFFFWCAASVVGGLIYGSMKRSISPMLLLLGMAALTIPMGFAQDTWTLAFLSLLPGLLCAPVLSASSEKVADLVEEDRRGEAMGWYGSALTAGVALGAPLAGVFIDTVGPSGGFAAVGIAGVVLCATGLVLMSIRRRAARV